MGAGFFLRSIVAWNWSRFVAAGVMHEGHVTRQALGIEVSSP